MPQVDFAPFLLGVADGKAEVARDIGTACEGIGFFYLIGHGIPAEMPDGIFSAARQIFTLPVEHKTDPDPLISREHNRGYQLVGARCYEKTSVPDLMEAFKYQRELAADDPDILAGDRIQQMNKWPANLWGSRERFLDYFDAIDGVSANLLRAFALALDFKEDYLLGFYQKSMTQISLALSPVNTCARCIRQLTAFRRDRVHHRPTGGHSGVGSEDDFRKLDTCSTHLR